MNDQHVYETEVRRISNAAAAGVTNITCSVIDMAGWDGVHVIAAMGALTATQVTSLKLQKGDLSNQSDAADETSATSGAAADADSNKFLEVDLYRPTKRYVTAVVVRGTANAVIDGVFAVLYRARTKSATAHTTSSKRKALVGA